MPASNESTHFISKPSHDRHECSNYRLTIPMERGTFQDSAAKLFNVLPANIRNCSDFKVYCREVNANLVPRAFPSKKWVGPTLF